MQTYISLDMGEPRGQWRLRIFFYSLWRSCVYENCIKTKNPTSSSRPY